MVVPVQRLRGFRRVTLQPGERRTVALSIPAADLALLDAELRWTVEPGAFELRVGASSRDIRLTERFEVLP